MNTRHLLLALLVTTFVFAAAPAAGIEKFTEDFTTTQYKDTPNTTAVWDTVAGEVRMYEYEVNLAATYDTPGLAIKVAIDGNYAFVGDRSGGVRILDISDPATPVEIGSIATPDLAFGVAVDGDYLFVAAQTAGVVIYDISDPTTPVQIGLYNTSGFVKDLVAAGDLLYVADSTNFLIIDVSDPTTPVAPYSYHTSKAWDVAVAGRHAYVVDNTAGLLVFDLVFPQALVATVPLPSPGLSIAVEGNTAYIGGWDGLHAVNITDPANPIIEGTYGGSLVYCEDVAVEGSIAYAAFRNEGLQMIDISDPASMGLLMNYSTPGDAYGMAVDGEYAFVAGYASGLNILQVAQPVNPPRVGNTISRYSYSYEAEVRGHYVYAGIDLGLGVFDISDPDTLVEVAYKITDRLRIFGLDVAGDYVYTTNASYLRVLDIGDPTAPSTAGLLPLPSTGHDVTIYGNYAFIASLSSGLAIVNVEDPTSPYLTGGLSFGGSAGAVAVAGNYAYVCDGPAYLLHVLDVSNPAVPAWVTSIGVGNGEDVEVAGNYLYVARDGGLSVVDITDPTSPVVVGSYGISGNVRSVEIEGNYAFVGSLLSGMTMVDITTPTSPGPGVVATGLSNTRGIAVSGEYAYCFNGSDAAAVQVFSPLFDTTRDVVQSTSVLQFTDPEQIPRWVRLTTAQTDAITWEVNVGGIPWYPVTPGDWTSMGYMTDVRWRATLVPSASGYNPSCRSLDIEWLYEHPVINSIEDVPNDEGRQVRISWQKTGYDAAIGSSPPITGYAVYRRIDSGGMATSPAGEHARGPDDAPPGYWDYVKTVPARTDDEYSTFAPTLVDSSGAPGAGRSVFYVRAITAEPYYHYDSPPDSGYSVDNLSPVIPTGLSVAYAGASNALEWEPSAATDFDHFEVHRADLPEFEIGIGTLVYTTVSTSWDDADGTPFHHYRLVAVDRAGNRSDPADPTTTTAAPGPPSPQSFALHQNIPNPFNPSTVIPFDVPAGGGEVTLAIFDVAGRRVTTLVDGFVEEGRRRVTWYGNEERGRRVASGVYFMRLTAPGYTKTIKLTVVQ